jgi:hypothetical protein
MININTLILAILTATFIMGVHLTAEYFLNGV